MSVGGIDSGAANIDGVPIIEPGSNSELGQDAFLTLLLTQLSNQDPLDPISNEDFIAQQATLSQLEQTTQLNEKFDQFFESQSVVFDGINSIFGSMQSMNLLGTIVEYPTSEVVVSNGVVDELFIDLSTSANVGYTVLNSSGNVLRQEDPVLISQGNGIAIGFDGLDDFGQPLSDGTYTVQLNVTDSDGTVMEGIPYSKSKVTSVDFRGGVPTLRLANGLNVGTDAVLALNTEDIE